jgi:hypothetical protein
VSEVRIHHPRWNRTLSVPADLWPGRLANKGWQLAEGETVVDLRVDAPAGIDLKAAVADAFNRATRADDIITTPPTQDLSEKEQLQQVLRERGVPFHHRLGVAKLRQLAEETE